MAPPAAGAARCGFVLTRAHGCSSQMRREVQATVHAGFKDWLQRTGNIRQVTDLMAQQSW